MSTHNSAAIWGSIAVTALTALWGGAVSSGAMGGGGWYERINKPDWLPPRPVFSYTWAVLFVVLAYAGYVALSQKQRIFAEVFGILLLLNILWSICFFQSHDPNMAVIIAFLLILVTIWFMRLLHGLRQRQANYAVWLLWLLLVWEVFALFSTIAVANMN